MIIEIDALEAHLGEGGQLTHRNALDLLALLKLFAEQAAQDLNEAHNELMKAQGHGDFAKLDWPEWSSPANTIRWAERICGKRLAKTAAWTQFPPRAARKQSEKPE